VKKVTKIQEIDGGGGRGKWLREEIRNYTVKLQKKEVVRKGWKSCRNWKRGELACSLLQEKGISA